jgi:hypothetical protein
MAKKLEGIVFRDHFLSTDQASPRITVWQDGSIDSHAKIVTLVIHEAKPERVYTESEVKAMVAAALESMKETLPHSPGHVGQMAICLDNALLDAGINLDFMENETAIAEAREQIINYIENDAEILIPIEDFFNEDGSHLTKKQYGIVLLKHLAAELRERFL